MTTSPVVSHSVQPEEKGDSHPSAPRHLFATEGQWGSVEPGTLQCHWRVKDKQTETRERSSICGTHCHCRRPALDASLAGHKWHAPRTDETTGDAVAPAPLQVCVLSRFRPGPRGTCSYTETVMTPQQDGAESRARGSDLPWRQGQCS